MTENAPLFHPLPIGGCINRWHVSAELAEHYPGTPRAMPDTIDYRFVNGWVDTGDLPCREAWRAALARSAASDGTGGRSGDGEPPVPLPMSGVHPGGEDERVDFSSFRFRPTLVTRWARVPLEAAHAVEARFAIDTCGALDLWLDGRHRLAFAPCSRNRPLGTTLACTLGAGRHELLVRVVDLHERDTDFHFRVRLLEGSGLSAGLDAAIDEVRLARVEALLNSLHLGREFHESGSVRVHAEAAPDEPVSLALEVDGAWSGSRTMRVAGDAHPLSAPVTVRLSRAAPSATLFDVVPLHAGCLRLHFVATLDGVEIRRTLGTTLLPPSLRLSPSTPLDARKREVLERLVRHGRDELTRALVLLEALARGEARAAVSPHRGRGKPAAPDTNPEAEAFAAEARTLLHRALRVVDERHDCADFQLMPLLWIWHRHRERLDPGSRAVLERSLLGFRYWLDEPGDDVMWFWSENHVLCFQVARHVAGHAFAHATFTNSGRRGAVLAADAAAHLARWFEAIERHGFGEWNSAAYCPIDLVGLLTLAEFTPDAALARRARALCDTVFRMTALHLQGGVPAGSEGRTYEKELLSGPANELGSVAAMAFGGPWYPGHDRASVLFALSRYTPPDALATLVRVPSGRALSVAYAQGLDGLARLMLWKSRHAQLSAVVDHASGTPGHQQHVVDVQLDAHPMARFWINHPGELRPWGNGRPSYLAGNGHLPQVAMHGRHAVLLYALPEAAEVPDFTHARVPEAACDELVEFRHWLFARAGDGYVALFAARGIEPRGTPAAPRTIGDAVGALRTERRQRGRRQAWVVVAGGRDIDGDFVRFQATCRALAPSWDETGDGALAFTTPEAHIVCGFDGRVEMDGAPRAPLVFRTDGHEHVVWHDLPPRCGNGDA